jgi:hypothetical protein
MFILQANERFDEIYSYSVFKSVSVAGMSPVNMKILACKIGALQIDHKKQHGDFLKNGSNDFD